MYIKLGKTNINYLNGDSDNNYMIVSDIIDSTLSYESPVIVNTKEELDIWFSKNFTERNYLISLLENNVTLYLYKPISDSISLGESDKDYLNYKEIDFNSEIITENLLDEIENWKKGDYKLISRQKIPTKVNFSDIARITYYDGDYYSEITSLKLDSILEIVDLTGESNRIIEITFQGNSIPEELLCIYSRNPKVTFSVRLNNINTVTVNPEEAICIKGVRKTLKVKSKYLLQPPVYNDTVKISYNNDIEQYVYDTNITGIEPLWKTSVIELDKGIAGAGNKYINLLSNPTDNLGFFIHNNSTESLKIINNQYIQGNKYGYVSYINNEVTLTEVDSPNFYYVLEENEFKETFNSSLEEWKGFSIGNIGNLYYFKYMKNNDDFKVKYDDLYYYWEDDRLIPEDELVQNLTNKSSSLNNRSTLGILTSEFKNLTGIEYFYPEYRESELEHLGVFSETVDSELVLSSYEDGNFEFNSNRFFNKGLQSYVINVTIEGDISSGGFITLKLENKLYFFTTVNLEDFIDLSVLSNYSVANIVGTENFINNLKDSIRLIPELNENLDLLVSNDNNKLTIVSKSDPLFINDFYEFPGLKVEADFKESNLLLSKYLYKVDNKYNIINCEFYSKIIGTYDELVEEDGDIKVVIEKTDDDIYRVTISRFDYSEVFEGSITPIPGVATRLDYVISKYSKLVYCNFKNTDNGLVLGTYFLRNMSGIIEKPTPSYWMNSLDKMFGEQRTKEILPDFFLIRDMRNYIDKDSIKDTDYYKEYEKLLEYSEDLNFQFLIQNNESKYKYYLVSDIPETFNGYENAFYHKIKSFRVSESGKLNDNFYNYYEVSELPKSFKEKENSIYYVLTSYLYIKDDGTILNLSYKELNTLPTSFSKTENFLYKIEEGNRIKYYVVINGECTRVQAPIPEDELPESPDKGLHIIKSKYYVVTNSIVSDKLYIFKKVDELPETLDESNNCIYNVNEKIVRVTEGKLDSSEISTMELIEALNENNFIFNYTEDLDNRLVYFYNSIYINGEMYPGYSLFLLNIIKGDYKLSCKNINYDAPGDTTTYDNTPLEDKLDEYKSNYLTFNNHLYYYNKYQTGKYYNTTMYLRFILGKIVRELEKNKGNYIGEKFYRSSYNSINSILIDIQKYFKIVNNIEITNYEFTPEENSLSLEIDTEVNDIVDNDITLNITLNFNK